MLLDLKRCLFSGAHLHEASRAGMAPFRDSIRTALTVKTDCPVSYVNDGQASRRKVLGFVDVGVYLEGLKASVNSSPRLLCPQGEQPNRTYSGDRARDHRQDLAQNTSDSTGVALINTLHGPRHPWGL